MDRRKTDGDIDNMVFAPATVISKWWRGKRLR